MPAPVFTETLQISVVVRDLQQAMGTYVEEYGIGPWDIDEFNPETVSVAIPGFDGTIAELEEKGHEVVLGGEYRGVRFAYLSTDRDLGVITEIFAAPPGLEQKPDAVYPA